MFFTEYFSCIHKNFKVTFVKKISDTILITGILLYCPEYGLSKDADLSQPRSQAFTPFVICSTNFTQASQCLCHLQYKIHPGFSVSVSFAVQNSSRLLSVCVICSTNFIQASQCLRHLQYKLHPGFSVSASFAVQTSPRLLSVCVICSTKFIQAFALQATNTAKAWERGYTPHPSHIVNHMMQAFPIFHGFSCSVHHCQLENWRQREAWE